MKLAVVLFGLTVLASGCNTLRIPIPAQGGFAYELDMSKLRTGQPAIVPRNDMTHWDGQPMIQR